MHSNDNKALRHIGLLLLLSALVGSLFPLVKIAEESVTPLTLALSRSVLAATLLLFVVGIVMKRDLTPLIAEWRTYAVLGALMSVFFVSITKSEEYISASLASLLTCLIPISTFLISTLVMHWERFTLPRLGGAIIALAGVAMFIGVEKIQFDQSQLTGVGIIALGYIVYSIYITRSRACQLDPFLADARSQEPLAARLNQHLELVEFLELARCCGYAVEEADVLAAQERQDGQLSDVELQHRAGIEARKLRHFIQA